MAIFKRNRNIIADNSTGFGTNSQNSAGRFFDRNTGGANVKKRGIPFMEGLSWYHTMLALPRWKFWLMLLVVYITINIIFASVYYFIGIGHLGGMMTKTPIDNFLEAFFFSCQTFTTVGYGRINPERMDANFISSFEAFLGLLSFALATGLLYGRFSRPRAFLRFSDNAVIAPFKEGTALMFKMASYKNNHLSDAEAKVTAAMKVEENGLLVNKFFQLKLDISKINSLALSWTIVHVIDESSPFAGMTSEDLENNSVEVLVFIKAFDEVFANTVVSRFSYYASEIRWGEKFKIMYHPDETNSYTILDFNKLNETEKANIPVTVSADI